MCRGYDATILRAAGPALSRIQYIQSEVWLQGAYSYSGANNDYCLDVLPLMRSRGFEPTALSAAGGSEQYLALYSNRSLADVKHNRCARTARAWNFGAHPDALPTAGAASCDRHRFFFTGGGDSAQEFCDFERRYMHGAELPERR